MRQIIFRGKSLINGKWVKGDSIKHTENATENGIEVLTYIGSRVENACKVGAMKWVPVDSATVGQFTGLRDRNCDEIYEGDILNNYDTPNPLIVRWNAGGCFFGLFNSEDDCECDFTSLEIRLGIAVDAEITGNIHENPEQK